MSYHSIIFSNPRPGKDSESTRRVCWDLTRCGYCQCGVLWNRDRNSCLHIFALSTTMKFWPLVAAADPGRDAGGSDASAVVPVSAVSAVGQHLRAATRRWHYPPW